MRLNEGDKLSLRLRSAFQRLEVDSVARLLHQLEPGATLTADSLQRLAERLAEPVWSREAVRKLDASALTALRLIARVPHEIPAHELDACALLITPGAAGAPAASEQLLQAGIAIAVTTRSVFIRPRDLRLRLLGPLRERWLTLATPSADTSALIPPLPEGEEVFHIQKAELALGVALATMVHLRPRTTRYGDLHRGDEKAIVEKIATIAGGEREAQELVRELVRRNLVVMVDGRATLNDAMVAQWRDSLARLLQERLAARRATMAWRASFAELIAAETWVPLARLQETAVLAVLEAGPYVNNAVYSVRTTIDDLRVLPGVLQRDVNGVVYLRLAEAARRVLAGQSSGINNAVGLLVQPNLEIVVQPGVPLSVIARLGVFCRLVNADAVAVFALDEAAARRSAGEGWSATHLLRLLEEHATHGVPATVARAITDWVRSRATATIATGVVVLLDLPVSEVRRLAGPVRVDEVATHVYRVDEADGPALLTALRKAGVACRSFAPVVPEATTAAPDAGPAGRFFQEFLQQAQEDVQRLLRVPND